MRRLLIAAHDRRMKTLNPQADVAGALCAFVAATLELLSIDVTEIATEKALTAYVRQCRTARAPAKKALEMFYALHKDPTVLTHREFAGECELLIRRAKAAGLISVHDALAKCFEP